MQGLIFKNIKYDSSDYHQAVKLREDILRKPLGLKFTSEEIAAERSHHHFAGYLNGHLCATAVMVPEGKKAKIQRVAVDQALSGKGIGTALMGFCEQFAIEKGITLIYCHARDTAVNFYLKNGWENIGEPFDEDTIPHQKMQKLLTK